eukprot:CAMPEP_0202697146 /NCGR_PEP_ID=MMETSP1385-20130828/10464_1 /ASSEMBLY_ACC=CAM_ASM_000861 /TAXON_ID=933848 /ORGANISM="Elphidium margaritaceum" /LENGTH=368 /DNA_ID=CAMNT_0049353519 /DNA_START=125 /DNA_END=1231 /DNA_ORIENTATION=-
MTSEIRALADGILSGKRRSLSRGITLIESTNPRHYRQAQSMLKYIYQQRQAQLQLPHASTADNNNNTTAMPSFRIGITGPPGAGKSTFVNRLGSTLCDANNKRVSVLPVDPSSFFSGGSILGDSTRMGDLQQKRNAYVRPSPNRCTLGGVTDTTYEVCTLCEAAGYDTIFVETVGVGQAEIEVAHCVDMFILIITPSSGDELQGIKRGIMEMADLVVVNKAEGDMVKQAKHMKMDTQRALSLSHSRRAKVGWSTKVMLCSSLASTVAYKDGGDKSEQSRDHEEYSVAKVWTEIEHFRQHMLEKGELQRCRREQSKHATWNYVWRTIKDNVHALQPNLTQIEQNVMEHTISPREGSQAILDYIWRHPPQ